MQSLFGVLLEVLLVNLVLSGDNAVVIGLAARDLDHQDRRRAILLGGGLAVILRLALTVPAEFLLQVPLLRAAGGLLLFWIAFRLLAPAADSSHEAHAPGLIGAVKLIVLADITMSLDNILAVAAVAERSSHPVFVLAVGLALSIPIVLIGGDIVARLMGRLPILVWIGAGVLAFTAAELVLEDEALKKVLDVNRPTEILIQLLAAVALLLFARWRQAVSSSGDGEPETDRPLTELMTTSSARETSRAPHP